MNAFRLPVAILSLFIHSGLLAQQFGGNPPSVKWQRINTAPARIIFPTGLDSPARQISAIINQLSQTTLPTIGGRQHRIDIVLQNQTVIPNGYVGLAPFRSEFYLTPDQNSLELGSLPWQKTLAIHEYRHVQQYNNFRVGLSKGFYYLFGEGGQALANALSIPNWFWEGDAVYQETLISRQGRGRLPYFFNGYRSLWAGNKTYSWMKLRNGSLRDYVPDHYPLGYMLVAYGRQRYGEDFWRKVTRDAASFHGLFYPLQKAIHRHAGISFRQFRKEALDHFSAYSATQDKTTPTLADIYARSHRHFAGDRVFPQFIGGDSLLYLHSSYRQIPAFVIEDKEGDHHLRNRAISIDNYYSYNGGRIVYAAYETDPRWGWRDYSVVRILDPATGEDRRLTSHSKYFAPDISADGRQIVAVQESPDGSCSLHVLDAGSGALLQTLPNKDSLFYTYPKFIGRDRIVTAVRNPKGEMSLALVQPINGSVDYLLPFSFQTIAFPSVAGDTIFFTASRGGEDRVYGISGASLFRITLPHGEPTTGQYGFRAAGGRYGWNTFTAAGQMLDTTRRRELSYIPLAKENWVLPLPDQGMDSLNSGPAHLLERIGAGDYAVKKYPSTFHLFNFHSWRPYVSDPDYTFSLVSENILNTLQSELYVTYNRNENYKQVGIDATYGALFPWLDIGADYVFDRNALSRRFGKVYWNEVNAYAGLSVPLNWTHGQHFTGLQFGSDLVYTQQHFTGAFKDSFVNNNFTYLRNFVSFSHQVQKAQQQIYPRFAQSLYMNYDRSVTASTPAHQFLASGYLYLPGLDFTHSLLLGGAFQQRDQLNRGGFSDGFPWSRGYATANFYRMWRVTANYHFPLLYPDWGIGNVVYFTRVRANGFYDYMRARDFYNTGAIFRAPFRSYGAEIFFDTKWWNQLPINFGVRYSRLVDPDVEGRGPNQWQLILPLNILSQGYSTHAPLRPVD